MDLVALARKIQALRTRKGMTAQALAKRAAVSKSLISRIENFRVTPSLPVLLRIAEALGVSAGEILDDISPSVSEVLVVRSRDRRAGVRNPERKGLRYLELAGAGQNRGMVPFIIELSPSSRKYTPIPHEGEEFAFVLKGSVRYTIGRKEYVLRAGDSIYLNAQQAHAIACVGKTPARLLSIISGLGKLPAM